MTRFLTTGAIVQQLLATHGVGQLGGEDAGGHGDDRVAGDHHQRGQHLAQRRDRHDVAEAHRGEGHDGPVDALGNAGEAMRRALDHVHQGAEHGDQGGDADQEHDDLLLAATQGGEQVVGLVEVRAELEDAKDPQHADDADDQQVLGVAVVQGDDPRHDGQQVDQAVEAEGIAQRPGRAVQARQVFDQEDRREPPLDGRQDVRMAAMHLVDAVEDDRDQAGQDDQQQDLVEAPASDRVGLEDDDVEAFAQGKRCVHECRCDLIVGATAYGRGGLSAIQTGTVFRNHL